MTILQNSERGDFYKKFLGSGRGLELQTSRSIPYEKPVSNIQKQIELSVTNGRGYLGLADSLRFVNRKLLSPLTPLDVIDRGLIPLYLGGSGPLPPETITKNPCGEIPLGESSPVLFSMQFRPLTLLEKIENLEVRWNPGGCFIGPRRPERVWVDYSLAK